MDKERRYLLGKIREAELALQDTKAELIVERQRSANTRQQLSQYQQDFAEGIRAKSDLEKVRRSTERETHRSKEALDRVHEIEDRDERLLEFVKELSGGRGKWAKQAKELLDELRVD